MIKEFMPYELALELKQTKQTALDMEKEQKEQAKLDAKEIIIIKHTEHGVDEQ